MTAFAEGFGGGVTAVLVIVGPAVVYYGVKLVKLKRRLGRLGAG